MLIPTQPNDSTLKKGELLLLTGVIKLHLSVFPLESTQIIGEPAQTMPDEEEPKQTSICILWRSTDQPVISSPEEAISPCSLLPRDRKIALKLPYRVIPSGEEWPCLITSLQMPMRRFRQPQRLHVGALLRISVAIKEAS